jgi:hypothetical protein
MSTHPSPTVVVVPPDGGQPIAAFGSTAVFKLSGRETGGALCLAVAETPQGEGFEEFYARCGEVFSEGGPPDRQRLASIAAEYGYQFLSPRS